MKPIRTIGLDKTTKKYKNMEKKLGDTKKLLNEIGSTATAMITQRTLAGTDVDGKAFKAYSPLYKQTRAKKGRSTTVNLSFTGRMLAAIKHKLISKTQVMLHFSRGEEGRKALYLSKERNFFGISKNELHKINEKLIKPWMRKLVK